ncbi:MAG: molecular chaperone DnaJ [Candidatus Gastranaerophilales bacterium]|nr:molecular chaperone DnaJ [Candidatus Gastranaerophilales bacterium]
MSSYYEILGVTENAGKDEIKSAFRKKARQLHPDVNKEPDAEEKFKELGKAYETLMDDDKRATYDRYGEDGLSSAGYSSQGPFDYGFGGLNDIFESFFGGGFGGFQERQADPNAPQQGADLRLDIELDFEEAVFGTEKEIKITHLEPCASCNGSGAKAGSKPTTCKTCGGTGRVQQVTQTILGHFSQITTCPNCHGTGQTITDPCPECKGKGRIDKDKKLSVKIPAGVDNRSKIRISGEGDAGKNGGPSGDLYIVLFVKESKDFIRKGNDIYTTLDVSFPQAALGDKVSIKTVDGEEILTIPQGVEHDKILTLKSKGVPFIGQENRRGDHHVIIKLTTPKNMAEEEKKLYSRLFEIYNKKKPSESIMDKVKSALHN